MVNKYYEFDFVQMRKMLALMHEADVTESAGLRNEGCIGFPFFDMCKINFSQ